MSILAARRHRCTGRSPLRSLRGLNRSIGIMKCCKLSEYLSFGQIYSLIGKFIVVRLSVYKDLLFEGKLNSILEKTCGDKVVTSRQEFVENMRPTFTAEPSLCPV